MPVSRRNAPRPKRRWLSLVSRSKTLSLRGQIIAGGLVRKGAAKTFAEAKRMLLEASRTAWRKRKARRRAAAVSMGGR